MMAVSNQKREGRARGEVAGWRDGAEEKVQIRNPDVINLLFTI